MPGFWEFGEAYPEVVIAIPHAAVSPLTLDFIGALSDLAKPPGTKLACWKGLPFHVVRNRLVRDALNLKARYIFFLDSDVLPPTNAITRLMSWRLPIISGIYWAKRGYPAMWVRDPEIPDKYNPVPIENTAGETLVEVDAIPMGCCLIDTRVFSVIPWPYFDWTILDPLEGKGLSEDLYFCRRAQEYGFRIWADKAVLCHHESLLPIDVAGKSDLEAKQAATLVRHGVSRE